MFKKFLIVLVVILVWVGIYLIIPKGAPQSSSTNTEIANNSTPNTTISTSIAQNSTTQQLTAEKIQATTVSTVKISSTDSSYINAIGTVKAQSQVKVYPQTSAQINKINVSAGATVQEGDVLFVLKGQNDSNHTSETQLKIAETNYKNAKLALQNTIASNESSSKSAQLQLQSAQDQAEGAYTDLKTFDQNIQGNQNSLSILQNSLNATREKNDLDFQKTQKGIHDLEDVINKLNDQKYRLINTLNDQTGINYYEDQSLTASNPVVDLQSQIAALDKQLNDLYTQLENAKTGYKTLVEASKLSENQLLSQLKQSQNQNKVLQLNQDSLAQKLGLEGGSADAVKMAEESMDATRIRNNVALTQAQSQLDLAKLNLDLAQTQVGSLIVKAPTKGMLDKINVSVGDIINPQLVLTQIISPQSFDLEVGVSIEDADKINLNDLAQVKIGGRFLDVPMKSISPVADANSKLVMVTLRLPKISFKVNQTLEAKIPLHLNQANNQNQQVMTIPLDAVIVGSEEQYVFIVGNGKAVKRNVKLGEITGDRVQILDGLSKSDQIVVNGAKDLIDGQAITDSQ